MKNIDVVNPTTYSRRTAWTLLSQLITALAKKQAAAVNECYGKFFMRNNNPIHYNSKNFEIKLNVFFLRKL